MFDMMGQLMLLARGKVIYFNEASRAVDYFASIDYRVPELCNPADYFMQIMSIESIEQARQVIANSFPLERFEPQQPEAWNDAYGRFQQLCSD